MPVHILARLLLAAGVLPAGAGPWAPSPLGPPGPGATAAARAPADPGPGGPACGWRVPVTASVSDPYRPPADPYGPGNRGIEYGSAPDQPVAAVAAGRVELAGPVAGRRWVVVVHDHDLRSTYGPLASVAVQAGQTVVPGQVVGLAGGPVLLTARLAGRYVDPGPLLAGRCGRLRLVPVGGPVGEGTGPG